MAGEIHFGIESGKCVEHLRDIWIAERLREPVAPFLGCASPHSTPKMRFGALTNRPRQTSSRFVWLSNWGFGWSDGSRGCSDRS